jgi:hypothetical protein
MKEVTYTTVNRIFSKLSRDLGIDDFSEVDAIEWAGEALEAIDAVTMLEECVEFIEVKNHSIQLPKFTNSIIQIAEHNGDDYSETTPTAIVESICDITSGAVDPDCGCDTATKYVPVDETGYPIFIDDVYEWQPYINVQAEYVNWTACDLYKNTWTPVRLADHTFFNSVVCQERDSDLLYSNSKSEYTIVGDSTLRFSFQEGYVAISYNRQKLDENMHPMIPDHFAYVTAVTKYITFMMMQRMWYMGRDGYEKRMLKAEADWQWYCKQAGNRALMPKGIDAYQNMLDQSQYLIPRNFRYNQFFKDLGRPEQRKFNDPDNRNNPKRMGGGIGTIGANPNL